MPERIEQRLIKLESLLAMQDHVIDDLNEVVIRQQKDLDKLRYEVDEIRDLLSDFQPGDQGGLDQRPPHY